MRRDVSILRGCQDILNTVSGPEGLKRVRSLHQKKYRDEQGLFLVQGRKLVEELLRSTFEVLALHATAEAARDLGLKDAFIHPAHQLEKVGTLGSGNEVVAVVRKPKVTPMAAPAPKGLVLALDGIADPGNLGTVLRIADRFGAEAVWCAEGSVEVFNPKCVGASMGSIFRVPVSYGPLPDALTRMHAAGVHIYKAEGSGTDVFDVELKRPSVLVLGSESHGLSEAVISGPGVSIAIPNWGGAESLNVAMAAAALCMEFARRNR